MKLGYPHSKRRKPGGEDGSARLPVLRAPDKIKLSRKAFPKSNKEGYHDVQQRMRLQRHFPHTHSFVLLRQKRLRLLRPQGLRLLRYAGLAPAHQLHLRKERLRLLQVKAYIPKTKQLRVQMTKLARGKRKAFPRAFFCAIYFVTIKNLRLATA